MARPGIEPRTSDLRVRCPTDCATRPGLIVRSTTVCLPVWKIIHLLKLVDYFFVQADKPWYNYYILLHLFSLMLGAPVAEGEIFSTVKKGSIAHSLSLSSANRPDMTEILLKRA